MEHVINFNFDAAPEKFKRIAQTLGVDTRGMTGPQVKKALFEKVRSMRMHLGISKSLGQVNVRPQDIPHLSEKALNDACLLTNPRSAGQTGYPGYL